jgi:uncharacterized protein (UPF0333 family)
MKSTKAQSELITTVLIILLVLAAIIIVWQVVMGVLNQGKNSVTNQANCMGLNLVVAKATNASSLNIVVRRDPGASSQNNVTAIVFLNGANSYTITQSLKELDSNTSTLTGLKVGDKIQLAGRLSDGTTCSLSAETLVTSS